MSILRFAFFTMLASGLLLASDEEPKKPTPKFKLSKETTFVTEPLDPEGYVDYETAFNTLLKGKTTPESNAVVFLLKALGPKPEGTELKPDFYRWLGVEAPPADGDYLKSHFKHFQNELQGEDYQSFNDLETRLRQRPWKDKDAPKHAEWLQLNAKPLAVAIEASKRKDYFHPLISRKPDGTRGSMIGALMPLVQKNREIAAALSLRAMLKVADGKIDDALEDVLAMHRLGRLCSRGGSLIELLVGIAIQSIAHNSETAVFEHGKLSAKQAMNYQKALLALPPMPKIADKISPFERISFLDAVQSMPRDGDTDLANVPGMIGKGRDEILKSIDFELIFRMGNTWFDQFEAAQRKPTRAERRAAGAELDQELKKLNERVKNFNPPPNEKPAKLREQISERIGTVYLGLLMPSFEKVGDASDRCEQIQRNGLLVTALAAHFAEEKKYPEKLSELAPKYIEKIPDDVFSGKALIYRRTDQGYLFYSVGTNGKDDGGTLLSDEPRGDDLGVRMPRK